jgi:hypothetical protein
MGLFSALFGRDRAEKAVILDEIDLVKAIDAHIHWKLRLQDYVAGTSHEKLDPLIIGRDDQCELGRWIHGAGMTHFHDVEAFHELRTDHAQFHALAANVVKEARANHRAGAAALLKGEYAHTSHKVVTALTDLHKAVAG